MSNEIEALRKRVVELETSGLHTCHDKYPRLACVQGREIRRLAELLLSVLVYAPSYMHGMPKKYYEKIARDHANAHKRPRKRLKIYRANDPALYECED